jgi:hypothetical protein
MANRELCVPFGGYEALQNRRRIRFVRGHPFSGLEEIRHHAQRLDELDHSSEGR